MQSTYLSCTVSVKTEYSEEILAYFMQLIPEMIAKQLNMQGEWRNAFDKDLRRFFLSIRKGIRLDIYVEDDEESVYDVEMQTVSATNLPKRSRYYQGMIDLNLIERGADYKELKQSYIIFICLSDCFNQGFHKYTFTNRCEEFPELEFEDETKKIFLCADGDKDDVSEELKQFLRYLVERKAETAFTKEIEKAVKSAGQHEKWRGEYMTLLMRDQENQDIGMERLASLIKLLNEKGLQEDIIKVSTDEKYREKMFQKYDL